jgi:carbon-monoxide dehydrogenase large subunit
VEPQIGKALPRQEDARLLTGGGRFTDDFNLPGQLHAAMVRSPYAHARIVAIDAALALAMPGVHAVLTGADWVADGLNPIEHDPSPNGGGGDLPFTAPDGSRDVFLGRHWPLPPDRARYVGEPVAMVVADTAAQARDAAERVAVAYMALQAVTLSEAAMATGAPLLWDEAPGNLCVDTRFGDAAATDAAFARAAYVTTQRFHAQRVTGLPLEPRAALGEYDAATGRYTLYAGGGGAVRQKKDLMLTYGVDEAHVRVVCGDVGGNFGTRNRVFVEFVLLPWAAKRLGRPVKYLGDRTECLVTDYQGRDLVTTLSLALDADGTFLALRADNICNLGSHAVQFSPLRKGTAMVTGPYVIPASDVRGRGVYSNVPPTNSYRSSGRPEVVYALERLIDIAAREHGFDPVELRRKNLIVPAAMPYTNPQGLTYDTGDFTAGLAAMAKTGDMAGFAARKADSAKRGLKRGRGIVAYVETSGGAPMERAELAVDADGSVALTIGTQDSGQGHATSYAQVCADWLGVDPAAIRLVHGDTDVVSVGGGSHAGRSMRMAGTAIVLCAEELIKTAKPLAGEMLEAAVEDIAFADGAFAVAGTDRRVGWGELAAAFPGKLQAGLTNRMTQPAFPNGAHLCEAEVDPETGQVIVARYVAIDDVGRVINPLIVDGQIHGGIVQGAAQALMEDCVFDADGQPLCGTLMDYAVPRAADMPRFETAYLDAPSPHNPLGVKSGGESGTTPALAAITNAVVDALAEYGVRDIAMPLTPHRVWRAIHDARGRS